MNCKILLLFVFLLLSLVDAKKSVRTTRSKDNIETMIDNAGFNSEVHEAETEDGYIIKLHRILKKSNISRPGPVFLQHGLLETSVSFIRTGPKIALSYLLSELGYDVWLGNVRGTDHGLRHKTLSVDSKEFWDFSWHEIGYYDIPATFDLMLQVTNSSRGFYFGHSQGGTVFAVMNSLRPEFNKKIIQAHLLAPAVLLNISHPLLEPVISIVESMAKDDSYGLRFNNFVNYSRIITEVFCPDVFNSETDFFRGLCSSIFSLVCGSNKGEEQLDRRILTNFLEHSAHSVSLKQFLHFFQLHRSQSFSQFNYAKKNLQVYGSRIPPKYQIGNINAAVFIYAGSCDILVSENGLQRLSEVLPNVKKFKILSNYNHCDFLFGKYSRKLYYEIVRSMQKF